MVIKSRSDWVKVVEGSIKNSEIDRKKYDRKTKKYGYSLHRKNSQYRRELHVNMTESEIKFGFVLCGTKLPFLFQKGFFIPFHRIADFYVPSKKLIIEVDGSYHDTIKEKDNEKDMLWKKHRNMNTLRISNEEVKSLSPSKLNRLIHKRAIG